MSNVLVIESALPDTAGANANVVLSGTSNGSVSFVVSRQPIYSTAAAATFTGAGPYIVALPHPDLWYIWVIDMDGVCAAPGASYFDEWSLIGIHLQSVLIANRAGLNAAIQTWIPGVTVGSIVCGSGADIDAYPAIVLSNPRMDPDWVGEPYLSTYMYQVMITCILLHEDEISYQQAATALTQCIGLMLRAPFNSSFTLASGHQIDFGQSRSFNVTEREIGTHWATIGVVQWSGLGQKLDPGN